MFAWSTPKLFLEAEIITDSTDLNLLTYIFYVLPNMIRVCFQLIADRFTALGIF